MCMLDYELWFAKENLKWNQEASEGGGTEAKGRNFEWLLDVLDMDLKLI